MPFGAAAAEVSPVIRCCRSVVPFGAARLSSECDAVDLAPTVCSRSATLTRFGTGDNGDILGSTCRNVLWPTTVRSQVLCRVDIARSSDRPDACAEPKATLLSPGKQGDGGIDFRAVRLLAPASRSLFAFPVGHRGPTRSRVAITLARPYCCGTTVRRRHRFGPYDGGLDDGDFR
jgi:hypothetical protein